MRLVAHQRLNRGIAGQQGGSENSTTMPGLQMPSTKKGMEGRKPNSWKNYGG